MPVLIHLCHWLNETSLADTIRVSPILFPIIETVHVLAITLLVGTAAIVDFRLLGLVLRREKVSEVLSQVEPLAWWGFAVMFVSGALLFLSEADKSYANPAFRLKFVLLFLAGLNPLIFHLGIYRRVSEWNDKITTPWQARATAIASLTLWGAIIILGRAIAYYN